MINRLGLQILLHKYVLMLLILLKDIKDILKAMIIIFFIIKGKCFTVETGCQRFPFGLAIRNIISNNSFNYHTIKIWY